MKRTLQLRVGSESLLLELRHGTHLAWSGEAAHGGPESLADAVCELLSGADHPPLPQRLRCVLEESLYQKRALEGLPPVKSPALAELVEYQARRYFRRNGHPLITDAKWEPRDGGQRQAVAVAAESHLVEAIVAGVNRAGLSVESMGPEDNELRGLSLLPASERARMKREVRSGLGRLALSVTVIWMLTAALVLGRLGRQSRSVDAELASLAPAVAAVRRAREGLHRAEAMEAAVTAGAGERDRFGATLAAIVAALPDSAWLTSLTLDSSGTGWLSGLAPRAVDVVARLERSKAIATPRLEGSVVAENTGARQVERFTIQFGSARGR